MMDKKGLDLSETVWTRLDRKAGAIVELTMRQLRHRISTWVVLGVGALLMVLLLSFYVDSVRESFEPIDNDGDSEDNDGDGFSEFEGDCDDSAPDAYPGAAEFESPPVHAMLVEHTAHIRDVKLNRSGGARFDGADFDRTELQCVVAVKFGDVRQQDGAVGLDEPDGVQQHNRIAGRGGCGEQWGDQR